MTGKWMNNRLSQTALEKYPVNHTVSSLHTSQLFVTTLRWSASLPPSKVDIRRGGGSAMRVNVFPTLFTMHFSIRPSFQRRMYMGTSTVTINQKNAKHAILPITPSRHKYWFSGWYMTNVPISNPTKSEATAHMDSSMAWYPWLSVTTPHQQKHCAIVIAGTSVYASAMLHGWSWTVPNRCKNRAICPAKDISAIVAAVRPKKMEDSIYNLFLSRHQRTKTSRNMNNLQNLMWFQNLAQSVKDRSFKAV